MENLIVVNKEELEKKKAAIVSGGAKNLQIISDFDKTLTRAFNSKGGKNIPIIAHLRNGKYLTKEYAPKAHELFNKYHPIEESITISEEEKTKEMHNWWSEHYKLLGESGLDKETIKKATADMIKDESLEIREGFEELFEEIKNKKIPMIIMSASIGDIIEEFFKQKGLLEKEMHIVSNFLTYNKEGKFTGIMEPIIHSMNKRETIIKNFPFYKEISGRKNVLLIGDSQEDPHMADGLEYENIIKIGLLSEKEELLEGYKKLYDIVILGDGSLKIVNEIIKEVK